MGEPGGLPSMGSHRVRHDGSDLAAVAASHSQESSPTPQFKSINSSALSLYAAKLLQSCLTLCDPIDGSPPGSPIPGILQARTLEWVAISFSSA